MEGQGGDGAVRVWQGRGWQDEAMEQRGCLKIKGTQGPVLRSAVRCLCQA